jgi:hypothetical protein
VVEEEDVSSSCRLLLLPPPAVLPVSHDDDGGGGDVPALSSPASGSGPLLWRLRRWAWRPPPAGPLEEARRSSFGSIASVVSTELLGVIVEVDRTPKRRMLGDRTHDFALAPVVASHAEADALLCNDGAVVVVVVADSAVTGGTLECETSSDRTKQQQQERRIGW